MGLPGSSGDRAPRRARNPQGQGARLRAELIDAADRILARTGDVPGLSLRAVAREAGVATPSIYLHFPDKTALVRAVLDARFAQLADVIRAAVSVERDPARQLRAGCASYCRFATTHPNAYRVLFGRASRPPADDPRSPAELTASARPAPHAEASPTTGDRGAAPAERLARVPGTEALQFMAQGIRACIERGDAPPADPTVVAVNVWTALHGIVSLRGVMPDFPWPPLDDQLDAVLTGLVGLTATAG